MAAKSTVGHRRTIVLRLAVFLTLVSILYTSRGFWLPQRHAHQSEAARLILPFTPPKTARPEIETPRTVSHESTYTSISAASPSLSIENAPQPQAIPKPSGEEHPHGATSSWDSCVHMPGAEKVMLLLKTGATELYQKLPIHFLTTLRCINSRNLIIFSDLAQTFADHSVIDALAGVSSEFRDHHSDFDFYRKLQDHQREGKDVSKLKGDNSWDLDKWKFLPITQPMKPPAPIFNGSSSLKPIQVCPG